MHCQLSVKNSLRFVHAHLHLCINLLLAAFKMETDVCNFQQFSINITLSVPLNDDDDDDVIMVSNCM